MKSTMIWMATVSACTLLSACAGKPVEPAAGTAPSGEAARVDAGGASEKSGARRDVSVDELKTDLEAGRVAVLIDVRTPGEYSGGHVKGALNIPVDTLQGRLAELSGYQGKEVYVICQSGRRSDAASQLLTSQGWSAVNVMGGTGAWKAQGYPVE